MQPRQGPTKGMAKRLQREATMKSGPNLKDEIILDDDFICGDCAEIKRTRAGGHYKYTCPHLDKVVDPDTVHPECPYLDK